MLICLEGHQLVTLSSAEVMRDVIDEVGSPWVGVDFDPVNWITVNAVFQSAAAIQSMLETLGDRIVAGHLKDVWLRDEMVVHLEPRAPGQGMLDIGAQLVGMHELNPDAPIIVEATDTVDLPGAVSHLRALAARHELEIRS